MDLVPLPSELHVPILLVMNFVLRKVPSHPILKSRPPKGKHGQMFVSYY